METAASAIRLARLVSGLSKKQLAQLAGVSPSTVGRVESGALDPTVAVFTKLMSALGYAASTELRSLQDAEPAVAAVRAMGEGGFSNGATERWARAGLLDPETLRARDFSTVALLAGTANQVAGRPGAVRFENDRPWASLAAELGEWGIDYAVTGLCALAREGGSPEPVIYVGDVARAAEVTQLTPKITFGPGILLLPLPADLPTEVEAGLVFTTPEQALVDSYASSGRAPDQADGHAARLERERGLRA